MAMMTLGMFLFETDSAPYTGLTRATDWRHATAERFGVRPAAQFTGPGDDKITLSGTLYGGQIGKYTALDTLREMADAGEAYMLLDGAGRVMGHWFIRSLSNEDSLFFIDGAPRKKTFTLNLERAADDLVKAVTNG